MTAMQNMEQTNAEIRELTDADLEAISGGSLIGDIGRWIVRGMKRDSDQRRPTA